jgi:hypothetical protein
MGASQPFLITPRVEAHQPNSPWAWHSNLFLYHPHSMASQPLFIRARVAPQTIYIRARGWHPKQFYLRARGWEIPKFNTNKPIFYYHKIPQNSIILKNQYIFTTILYKIQVNIPKFLVYCIIFNF